MKKLLLSLLFVLFGFVSNAQGYEPVFGKTQTSWNVFAGYTSFYTDSFYVVKDTTMGGKDYKMALHVPATPMSPGGGTHFLREDTITGRLWYRPASKDTDVLIMDMGLQVGDSFNFDIWPYPKVDSVYVKNGRRRVRFTPEQFSITGIYKKLEFIEGVGPNFGVYPDPEGLLLCAMKDNQRTYITEHPMHPAYSRVGDCAYYMFRESVEETDAVPLAVKAYPNPAGDRLSVSFTNYSGALTTLEIYNTTGQRVHSQTTTGSAFEHTDLQHWPTGLYLYFVKQGEKAHTGKLVIE